MQNAKLDYSRIAVLVPCYNEELTVGQVVQDFKRALPGATVYVFDNNSKDKTVSIAKQAGAMVVHSPRQGKGNVVRHMFSTVEADVYIMVDGDSTYPADAAPELVSVLVSSGVDMVVGTRIIEHDARSFRRFHKIGNILITGMISFLFRINVTDVLSGYRVFSRRMVKTVPLMAEGFEVETELTLQTATKGFSFKEVQINYGKRPEGSFSKLSTYADGLLILKAISVIFKDYKPLVFFGAVSIVFAVLSLIAGSFPILDYYEKKFVDHVPLAILAAALGILSMLALGIGLILDTAYKYHCETFELWRRRRD
ncbi:MAG: glycosyltransferase family 2 protein [Bdellovibrionota bacterium]